MHDLGATDVSLGDIRVTFPMTDPEDDEGYEEEEEEEDETIEFGEPPPAFTTLAGGPKLTDTDLENWYSSRPPVS